MNEFQPLSPEERERKKLAFQKELDRSISMDLTFSSETKCPSSNEPRFENTAVAGAMLTAYDTVKALVQKARQAGAGDMSTALEAEGGRLRYFAVGPSDEHALAIQTDQGNFLIHYKPEEAGFRYTINKWKPDAPQWLVDEIQQAPTHGLTSEQVMDWSRKMAPFADLDGDDGLEDALSSGETWNNTVAAGCCIDVNDGQGEAFYSTYAKVRDFLGWKILAQHLSPMIPPSSIIDREEMGLNKWYVGPRALELDDGFWRETCTKASDRIRRTLAKAGLQQSVQTFKDVNSAVIERGYEWGKQYLVYMDHDRMTFGVKNDRTGVMGRWHKNIDLCSDVVAHMVVILPDEEGKPEHLAIYPCYEPFYYDEVTDEKKWLLSTAKRSADLLANPPRHTRRDLAEAIVNGICLPEPPAGMNLKTGKLYPGTEYDPHDLIRMAITGGLMCDKFAMDEIADGKMPGLMKEACTDFGELGEEGWVMEASALYKF